MDLVEGVIHYLVVGDVDHGTQDLDVIEMGWIACRSGTADCGFDIVD